MVNFGGAVLFSAGGARGLAAREGGRRGRSRRRTSLATTCVVCLVRSAEHCAPNVVANFQYSESCGRVPRATRPEKTRCKPERTWRFMLGMMVCVVGYVSAAL